MNIRAIAVIYFTCFCITFSTTLTSLICSNCEKKNMKNEENKLRIRQYLVVEFNLLTFLISRIFKTSHSNWIYHIELNFPFKFVFKENVTHYSKFKKFKFKDFHYKYR